MISLIFAGQMILNGGISCSCRSGCK